MTKRSYPSVWKQTGLTFLFLFSLFEDQCISAKAPSTEKISISPTPQEEFPYGKGFYLDQPIYLTAGRNVSFENIAEFKKILQNRISGYVGNNPKSNTKNRISAILITTSDDRAVKRELKKIGIPFTKYLPPEGYLLATGQDATGNRRIVLVGSDQNGLYYAEQTLSQILSNRRKAYIPGVMIWDWPGIKYRGVIEGFYGRPWNLQDRMRIIAFCAHHKMNMYVYAPKDDVYHRSSWKVPYPPRKLKEIQQVIRFADKNHMKFVFAISPGSSICYSNKRDLRYIMDKSQVMWNSGVRDFAILFDDISRHLKYPQDRALFGTSSGSLASAQAHLLNQFNQKFIHIHPGAQLMTVPTDYFQTGHTVYRDNLAKRVAAKTAMLWTGNGVVARTVNVQDFRNAESIFKHPLVLWDNYPVNDYKKTRLFLGPLEGRSPFLGSAGITGFLSNPMQQSEASKIPLFTIADYAWNPKAYDPEQSWQNALHEIGGDAFLSLRIFAENNRTSLINHSPHTTSLSKQTRQFWATYKSRDNHSFNTTSADLMKEFQEMQNVPEQLRVHMQDSQFIHETEPWLDQLKEDSKTAQIALQMLHFQRQNDVERAAKERQNMELAIERSKLSVVIPSELRSFIVKARSENNRWIQTYKWNGR